MNARPHRPGRRTTLRLALGSALAAAGARVWSRARPSLSIVVPFTAGGSVDHWGRQIAEQLETRHGHRCTVLNRPGADGAVAARTILHDWPDGSIPLLISTASLFAVLPQLPDAALGFDPNEAFVPVCLLWEEPVFVVARSDGPVQRLDDLRRPPAGRPPSFGSSGPRSAAGLYFERALRRSGVDAIHIPHKGMAEVYTQLWGGHVDLGLLSYHQARPGLDAGVLRLLASTGPKRSPLAPDVPTLLEARLAPEALAVWGGLFAPRSVDPALRGSLEIALAAMLRQPEWAQAMRSRGYEVLGLTGAAAQAYLRASRQTWQRLLG